MKTINWARRTHGRVATYNAGCRCRPCTDASSQNQASYRERSRAQRDQERAALTSIVRALAASDANEYGDDDWHQCGLCDAQLPVGVEGHDPECPWKRAAEWVRINPVSVEGRTPDCAASTT